MFPDEQQGYRKRSQGMKDQFFKREVWVRKMCLVTAWKDYQKAYDMVPHSWIAEMLETLKVPDKVKGLLCGSMSDWKTVVMDTDSTSHS